MKIKLMIVASILLAIGIGAIFVYIPLKQEKDRLASDAQVSKQTATTLKSQVADMQKKEAAKNYSLFLYIPLSPYEKFNILPTS